MSQSSEIRMDRKKIYHSPRLTIYGKLAELTKSGTSPGMETSQHPEKGGNKP